MRFWVKKTIRLIFVNLFISQVAFSFYHPANHEHDADHEHDMEISLLAFHLLLDHGKYEKREDNHQHDSHSDKERDQSPTHHHRQCTISTFAYVEGILSFEFLSTPLLSQFHYNASHSRDAVIAVFRPPRTT